MTILIVSTVDNGMLLLIPECAESFVFTESSVQILKLLLCGIWSDLKLSLWINLKRKPGNKARYLLRILALEKNWNFYKVSNSFSHFSVSVFLF